MGALDLGRKARGRRRGGAGRAGAAGSRAHHRPLRRLLWSVVRASGATRSPRSCQLKGFNPWLPSVWTLAAVVRGPALRPLYCGGLTVAVALLHESVSPAAVTAFPVERDP